MAKSWNPWHGCRKYSSGCLHCYVHRSDIKYDKDPEAIYKTKNFSLPILKKKDGSYRIPSGELVWTCFTSDFFLEDADPWRKDAWHFMKERQDLRFFFITKRIHRFYEVIPSDWGNGYPNVAIGCTVENQVCVNQRLPIFREIPVVDKTIVCAPLLETVNLSPYLGSWVKEVVVGGESCYDARCCDFQWVKDIAEQCKEKNIPFWFKETGSHFIKDGKLYYIPRKYQHRQGEKSGLSCRRFDAFR